MDKYNERIKKKDKGKFQNFQVALINNQNSPIAVKKLRLWGEIFVKEAGTSEYSWVSQPFYTLITKTMYHFSLFKYYMFLLGVIFFQLKKYP